MNISAKPTRYGGVNFRSRLEARFAEMLDKNRIDWTYEPETYIFGNYLPDFYLPLVGSHGLFVEIKPARFLSELAVFWDKVWIASAPWICVDKGEGWRDRWVMLQANLMFRGNLRLWPVPTPIKFQNSEKTQWMEINVDRVSFVK